MKSAKTTERKVNNKINYHLPKLRGDKLDLPPLIESLAGHTNEDNPYKVLDLFCGAGGMSLGFEDVGFQVTLGVDHDFWACKTFAANIPAAAIQQDLNQLDNGEKLGEFLHHHGVDHVTGIIGGPPCQGYSKVGRARLRHRDMLQGHNGRQKDERNTLYRRFLAAVQIIQPQFFVMENVPDLDTYLDEEGTGLLADRIQAEFTELGYVVERKILNAENFGVPQSRSRLFFIGLQQSLGANILWPDGERARQLYGIQTLRAAIGDLPDVPDGYTERETAYETPALNHWLVRWFREEIPDEYHRVIFDHITRPHREDDKMYFQLLQEGQKYIDLPENCRRYRSDIFKDKYRKLIWDEPSWTITAHMRRDSYRYIHPATDPPRTISLREAARIQSFPDRWRFCGYRSNAFVQVGNAVPPLLARAIAKVIMTQLSGQERPDKLLLPSTSSGG